MTHRACGVSPPGVRVRTLPRTRTASPNATLGTPGRVPPSGKTFQYAQGRIPVPSSTQNVSIPQLVRKGAEIHASRARERGRRTAVISPEYTDDSTDKLYFQHRSAGERVGGGRHKRQALHLRGKQGQVRLQNKTHVSDHCRAHAGSALEYSRVGDQRRTRASNTKWRNKGSQVQTIIYTRQG